MYSISQDDKAVKGFKKKLRKVHHFSSSLHIIFIYVEIASLFVNPIDIVTVFFS